MSALRPNYRLARELKADIDDQTTAIAAAEHACDFDHARVLNEGLYALQHELFLTGVRSEYDL